MRAPVTFPTNVIAPITPELKPVINQVIILHFRNFQTFHFLAFTVIFDIISR